MNSPRVSVIIVSYQVRDLLRGCLQTLAASKAADSMEIIVVDNNSTDGSVTVIRDEFPQVVVIANSHNAGFSGANNQGIAVARGGYIFLLNPDTEVAYDAVSELEAYLDTHVDCVLAGPQLLNSDGTLQISAWKDQRVSGLVLESLFLHTWIHVNRYPFSYFSTVFQPEALSGAALFFRKELTVMIGTLDEKLFWMEDIDFCRRAGEVGKLAYLPQARVIHHSGQSQKKNYNVAISNQLLSKLKYLRKHTGMAGNFAAHVSCIVQISTRMLVFSIASPAGEIYRLKAKAYFYSMQKYLKYLLLSDQSVT